MRIHYLQHVPFEGLGYVHEWSQDQGHTLSATALFADHSLPDPTDFDWLVVMGGPMGVYDTATYPWLAQETRFISQSIRQRKKVLGICLGAQLIAKSLGADVYPNQNKEIGWHRVTRSVAAEEAGCQSLFPESFYAFHWHGDTYDLPEGAVHLAQSQACRQQAFFYPPGTLGLQFHLESTSESISALIRNCKDELVPAPYIQSQAQIQSHRNLVRPSNNIMRNVLNFIFKAS